MQWLLDKAPGHYGITKWPGEWRQETIPYTQADVNLCMAQVKKYEIPDDVFKAMPKEFKNLRIDEPTPFLKSVLVQGVVSLMSGIVLSYLIILLCSTMSGFGIPYGETWTWWQGFCFFVLAILICIATVITIDD